MGEVPGSLPPFFYRSAPACAYLTTADASNLLLVFPVSFAEAHHHMAQPYAAPEPICPPARLMNYSTSTQRVYLRFGPSTSRNETGKPPRLTHQSERTAARRPIAPY